MSWRVLLAKSLPRVIESTCRRRSRRSSLAVAGRGGRGFDLAAPRAAAEPSLSLLTAIIKGFGLRDARRRELRLVASGGVPALWKEARLWSFASVRIRSLDERMTESTSVWQRYMRAARGNLRAQRRRDSRLWGMGRAARGWEAGC